MTAEQIRRRWQEQRNAQARRDAELETFPNTAGAQSKVSHPMFGAGRQQTPQQPSCELLFPVFENGE
jgi:hypothetical protein